MPIPLFRLARRRAAASSTAIMFLAGLGLAFAGGLAAGGYLWAQGRDGQLPSLSLVQSSQADGPPIEIGEPEPPLPALPPPAAPMLSPVEQAEPTPFRVAAAPHSPAPEAPAVMQPDPSNPPAAAAPTENPHLAKAFALTAETVFDHLPAELILLPSREPVELRAAVTKQAALPDLFRKTGQRFVWTASSGRITPLGDGQTARFDAPEQSTHVTVEVHAELDLERPVSGGVERQTLRLTTQLHLLTPESGLAIQDGMIDGYQIGHYLDPNDPSIIQRFNIQSDWFRKYPEKFHPPQWLYKVTPDLKPMKISPNLDLGFWVIDFPWKTLGMPQYIALDLNLVRKLEDLMAMMRNDGYVISRWVPIYGFRPPAFNLGTMQEESQTTLKVPFSQHQYGRAIDLIIDEDGDGKLDDLNFDGTVDVYDAAVIMHYVNLLDRKYRDEGRMEMVGGAGLYTHNDFLERSAAIGQTPYIHIDTRGFLEDNGALVRWPATWPDGSVIEWGKI